MKLTSIIAASFIVGAGAIMTVEPDSSVSLWINERDVTVHEVEHHDMACDELIPKPVRHPSHRQYGSVIIDTEPATGPPELDNYPIGPPSSNDQISSNYGLVHH